jgi:hypothetical protein
MKLALFSIVIATAAFGCSSRSGGPTGSNPDAPGSGGTPDAPSGTPDGAMATGCMNTYTQSSIAAMRQGTASGCFELDNVVSIATTPSKASPRLFVQDSGGGAFSAVETKCSSTSTAHPCTVSAQVAAIADSHSVTVKGTYIKSKSTGYEIFYIDSVTDNGAGTMPPVGTATLTDISRGGTNHGLAFQIVNVTIPSGDPLVMYDWSPPELVYTGATKCPYQFGFGMIPKSMNATSAPACASGTAQPTGQTTSAAQEVIIGTDFYKGFTISSDCQCAKTYSDMEPSATSQLTGSIKGILVFDVPFGSTAGYFYIAPKANADAAISGLVAGM